MRLHIQAIHFQVHHISNCVELVLKDMLVLENQEATRHALTRNRKGRSSKLDEKAKLIVYARMI